MSLVKSAEQFGASNTLQWPQRPQACGRAKKVMRILNRLARLLIALMVLSPGVAAQRDRTFTGEISDRDCSKFGGHALMLQKGETARDCTLICVKLGSKYVLLSPEDKTVYQLDDQKKPEQFAGEKVRITGTLDRDNHTIHVTEIKSAS
jgi:hypothetical protein